MAFGEVGLGGELRRVPHIGARLSEAAKLGFRAAVIPASQEVPPRALQALRDIAAKAAAAAGKEGKEEDAEEKEGGASENAQSEGGGAGGAAGAGKKVEKGAAAVAPMEIIRCKTVVEALGVLIEWPGSPAASKGGSWRKRGTASVAKRAAASRPRGEEDEVESDEAFFA